MTVEPDYEEGLEIIWVDGERRCAKCLGPLIDDSQGVPCCGYPYECEDWLDQFRCPKCLTIWSSW